jgi:large subunit ribosomal protein L21
MYAVIRAGGKQHKVAEGDVIEIEHLKGDSDSVEFTPLLVVDDKGNVSAQPADLKNATVKAKVLGEGRGPKIEVYKFRNKTGYRRHAGHRQSFSTIEISGISLGSKGGSKKKKEEAEDGS